MHMPPTSSVEPFSLKSTTGPWVVVTTLSDPTLVSQLTVFGATGGVIRHVDAANMMTENDLFREFAHSLGFQAYFGHNWDAMVDCLDDLHGDWHGHRDVAVIVDNAEMLLRADFLPLFISVLCQGAERANSSVDLDGCPLDRSAIALHFVLLSPVADLEKFKIGITIPEREVVTTGAHVLVT